MRGRLFDPKRSLSRQTTPGLAIACAIAAAPVAAAGPDTKPTTIPATAIAPPRDAILMFVAAWCAPCHGEIRDLESLSRTAAPRRVLIVPIDTTPSSRAMMARVPPAQRLDLPPGLATDLMRRLSGGAAGLPTTVATDRTGAVCAVHRKPLTVDDLPALAARC